MDEQKAAKENMVRLLLYSHFFAPGIGGVEKQVLSLARGLSQRDPQGGAAEFEVTVATNTAGKNDDDSGYSFRVVREPNLRHLWQLIRRAEVVHIAGPSL